jgi:hypothetical protein
MVLPSARRFTDLGVQPRQRLASLKEIEETPRDFTPNAPPVETPAGPAPTLEPPAPPDRSH